MTLPQFWLEPVAKRLALIDDLRAPMLDIDAALELALLAAALFSLTGAGAVLLGWGGRGGRGMKW